MATPSIGYAALQIIPSLRGVDAEINRQLGGKLAGAGAKAGSQFGQGFAASAGKTIATGFSLATAGAGALAAATLKAGLSYNVLESQARVAFKTLLGGKDAADDFVVSLKEFSKTSPFPRQAFIQGAQQLVAFGFEAEKVIPTLDAIQNAVAASGRGAQTLSEIVFVMGQISAAGKITGRDLIQFGDRGIDAAGLIGQAMGKTGAQIREDITAGAISADDAIAALTEGMQAKFAGAAEGVKATFVGALDRVKGASRDIGGALVEPFVSSSGGGAAVEWANTLADALRAIETGVVPKLVPAMKSVADSVDGVIDNLARFAEPAALVDTLDTLREIAPVVAGASSALFAFGSKSLPVVGSLLPAINPLVAGFAALAVATPGARDALAGVASTVGPLAAELGQSLVPILADLSDIAGTVLPPALTLVGDGMALVLQAANLAAPGVESLSGFLSDHTEIVYALVGAYIAAKTTAVATIIGAGASAFASLAGASGAAAAAVNAYALSAASASTATQALALTTVSASTALAGIGAGVALGAGLAMRSLAESANNGAEAADKFYASLAIDETDRDSILEGMRLIQGEMLVLQAVADDGSVFDRWWQRFTPNTENTIDEAVGAMADLNNKSARLEALWIALGEGGRDAADGTSTLTAAIEDQTSATQAALAPLFEMMNAQLGLIGSQRAVESSLVALADAQETAAGRGKVIADLQAAQARQAQQDAEAVAQAEQSAGEAVAAARENIATAIEKVNAAREAEVDATKDAAEAQRDMEQALIAVQTAYADAEESLKSLEMAQRGNVRSVADAQDAVLVAAQRLAEQQLEGDDYETPFDDVAAAQRDLEAAQDALTTARAEAAEGQEELDRIEREGLATSDEVVSALSDFETAQERADAAREAAATATAAVTQAEIDQKTAMDELVIAEIEGNEAIAEAKANLATNAQTSSTEIQTAIDDAKAKLPELTLAAELAALKWAEDWADAKVPIDVLSAGIDTLQGKLVPGSPLWQYLERLQFLAVLSGQNLPDVFQPNYNAGGGSTVNRMGGLYAFAGGGVTPAHVAHGTRYKWAEPQTGGEAFVPRLGDPARSRSILSQAAGWYGLDIIDKDARKRFGPLQSFAYGGIAGDTSSTSNGRRGLNGTVVFTGPNTFNTKGPTAREVMDEIGNQALARTTF
jgi:tape measure domain-containing protein